MSIFDSNETPITVDQLVGEGKKYANADELAKAYANAEPYIEQLKTELSGLRGELDQRLGAEELFQRIARQTNEPAAPVVAQAPKVEPPVGEPNQQVDLAQQIRDELASAREQEQVRANTETVANRLVEIYGTEDAASSIVEAKARELGVSLKFLQEVAVKSPKAFFTTMGIDGSTQPVSPPAPRGQVNTTGSVQTPQGASYGTKEYFDNIRRETPRSYWTPKVQNEIFKAKELGTYKT